jgi:uncharacterized MAPEG superfamily protein
VTVPLLTLLGFALWTLLVLAATVGVYRWALILTGRAPIHSFRADAANEAPWYQRAMRAHANCVENLPVYGAIVGVASFVGLEEPLLDVLSVAVLAARVCQTLVHVSFAQTDLAVSIRFTFFAVQLCSMFWMAVLILVR